MLATDQPDAAMGQIFNCGDDKMLTIRQVAGIITDECDYDRELISMPTDLAIPARLLMMNYLVTHRVMDIAKLCHRLGYRNVVPARQAVRLTVRWLLEYQPRAGGYEETALPDPFNYAAEYRIVARWRAVTAIPPASAIMGCAASASPTQARVHGNQRANTRI